MKYLAEYFENNKDDIIQKLRSSKSLEETNSIIQKYLKELMDMNGEYINSLTLAQSRVAVSLLETFRASIDLLANTSPAAAPAADAVKVEPKTQIPVIEKEMTRGAVVGGALSGALIGTLVGGVLGTILGTVGGTLVGTGIKNINITSKEGTIKQPIVLDASTADQEGLINEIVAYLEQICTIIDQVIAQSEKAPETKPAQPTIVDHPEVMSLFQSILGESIQAKDPNDPSVATAKEVSAILRKYKVRVEVFQNDKESENADWFDFEPNLNDDQDGYITLEPALLQENKVVCRGRVIEPPKNLSIDKG